MVLTYLELAKVYLRLDQPNTALDLYLKGVGMHQRCVCSLGRVWSHGCMVWLCCVPCVAEKFPGDIHLLLGIARVYEALNDMTNAIVYYKKVTATVCCLMT